MSFLNKFFGKEDADNQAPDFWRYIESEADLDRALTESSERTVGIFKHSTRCHISKTVLRNFEREVQSAGTDVSYYFLDLLANRSISNKIEDTLGVTHQSPQLIIIKDGKAVKDMSHHSISAAF